jgi:hypothetical protein
MQTIAPFRNATTVKFHLVQTSSTTMTSPADDRRPSCSHATRRGQIAMNIAKLQELLQQPKDEAAK